MFAADIRRRRARPLRGFRPWRRHLDEVFAKINDKRHYLWRAVGHECEIPKSYVNRKHEKLLL
jgi:putative transposase